LGKSVIRYVQNTEELLGHGLSTLRQAAIDIANSSIMAADPGLTLKRLLSVNKNDLTLGHRSFKLSDDVRIFVIGAGKATYPIAKVLDEALGSRIYRGLVTCKEGQTGALAHIELHWASHPIPGRASHEAAVRTQAILREARSGDIVLSCFTGGSSALFVDPITPLSLEDKIATNRVLLGCGANIVEINAVRKHLSRVKGGKLVRCLPAGVHLVNLTVSDVIGDLLDYITDPTVPDTSSFANAQATLDKYDLWKKIPVSVTHVLRLAPPHEETIREAGFSGIDRTDILLVKNDTACHAAAVAARNLGFTPLILSTLFEGESRELGRFMAATAKQVAYDGHPIAPPCILIGGGESTVQVDNGNGQGGPNQEFAVAFALDVAGYGNIVALSVDTDGTDGPTRIAGALVDGTTMERAAKLSIDLYKQLVEHDVTPALQLLGEAVVTGATGTNVNDLLLVLIGDGFSQQSIVDNR
jgi:glycerate 2-kinase